MTLFVSSLIGGVLLGATYALVSLGLVLAFRATRTFNFAYGEFMVLPAFIVAYLELRHMSFGLGLLIAFTINIIVGTGFYLLVLRRTTGLPLFMGVIATFGLASVLDGIMGILFPGQDYNITIPGLSKSTVHIAGAGISTESLILGGLALVLAVVVIGIARFTHLGTMTRAAGQDALLASQCGIRVNRVFIGSWAVASVLAAVAGISYGSSAVVSTSIVNLGLVAIPGMVLGGMDSIEGALIGGLMIGIFQGLVQTYLGAQYSDVLTYVLLLLVLLLRPWGLFGTKEVVRA